MIKIIPHEKKNLSMEHILYIYNIEYLQQNYESMPRK